MVDRSTFADFLDRAAKGMTNTPDWEHFVETTYRDNFLEEIRQCVERLMKKELPYHYGTVAGSEAMRCWAMALRSSKQPRPSNEVTISLTQHEAVVLDVFLRRFSETDELKIEHPAEKQALWNLQCIFEKNGNPYWPSLQDAHNSLS